MTLIPMMSAIVATPRTAHAPAGASLLARGSYDPGAHHRPFAAVLAIALPATLVVAVALSPMIAVVTAPAGPTIVRPVPLPVPPPPAPTDVPVPPSPPLTAPEPLVQTAPLDPVDIAPLPPLSPLPLPPVPGTGTGSTAGPVVPPAPPRLVLAQLDQRFSRSFQPDYPASEQRRGIEGVAKVRVLIGTDGRVKAVELVSTDSAGFFAATKERALDKWRFKPATRGGVAEESWKVMTVRFEIRGA